MEDFNPHEENKLSQSSDKEQSEPDKDRKITRSINDRIFLGVCGGISKYLEVDPIILRLIFVFSILIGGWGAVVYILAAMLIPSEKIPDTLGVAEAERLKKANAKTLTGTVFILIGLFFFFDSYGITGYFGALGIPPDLFWPVAFVVTGVYLYRKQIDPDGYVVGHKKFYRVRSYSRFMGVCSGLAVYLDTDSNLIRMTWIVLTFITLGLGIIIYFIIVFMVPYYNES